MTNRTTEKRREIAMELGYDFALLRLSGNDSRDPVSRQAMIEFYQEKFLALADDPATGEATDADIETMRVERNKAHRDWREQLERAERAEAMAKERTTVAQLMSEERDRFGRDKLRAEAERDAADKHALACRNEVAALKDERERFMNTINDLAATIERRADKCPVCGGHGADRASDNTNWLLCPSCGGSGKRRPVPTWGGVERRKWNAPISNEGKHYWVGWALDRRQGVKS